MGNTIKVIEELGGQALAVTCDVTRGEDVRLALDKTVETFGRLDFAFNNAGIEQPPTLMAEITEDAWDRIISINPSGTFLCMKHEIPSMLKQGGGAIVNTSSGAGVKGFKDGSAYGVAKYGVIGLTKCAALDYNDGSVHRGHARGMRKGDRAGTGWADGKSGEDCRGYHVIALG